MLAAAIYSYVDTVSMTFSIATDSVLGGYVGYVLTFVSDPYPSSTPATTGGLQNGEIYTHYSETPRGENGILPIESKVCPKRCRFRLRDSYCMRF